MARLPVPGSDDNAWGTILNDFLRQAHYDDGSIKDTGVVATKASDAAVVHITQDETVAGVKTFSSSPVVPVPTIGSQAATKAYVDSVASAGAPDATTINKGILQLSGDLSGTADTPTVPGLATKEPTIAAGVASQYYRGDKTWQTLDKAAVGLANVDNTSDANKPISTATQLALDLKQDADADLTAIAALTPTDDDILQRKAGVWTSQTPTSLKSDLALTKSDVGLANVDNTSDANKPISTATQAALDAKADDAAVVHITQDETVDGIKTFNDSPFVPDPTTNGQAANKAYVDSSLAAGVVDATTTNKGILQLAGDLSGTADTPTVPGLTTKEPLVTAGTTTQYYRGDKSWQTLDKASVGLANVDNTSDANKPVSAATQAALDGKTDKATLTTKGDLYVATAAGVITRLPAGTDDQILTSDSAQTEGVKWATAAATPDATTTSKGIVQLAGDLSGTADTPTVPGLTTKQPLDSDLTDIAALSPGDDDILQRKAGVWVNSSLANVKTDLALTKADVGLGNVDNTSDVNKPISTATQAALDAKADDAAVVHITQDETIAGQKTFTDTLRADGELQAGTQLRLGPITGPLYTQGTGSPEGVVSAPVGSQFARTDGAAGTVLYIKETGNGNTGWVALSTAAVNSVDGRTGAVTLSDLYVDITGDTMTGDLQTPRLGVGVAPGTDRFINVSGSPGTQTSVYAVSVTPLGASTATALIAGIHVRVDTVAEAFTTGNVIGVWVTNGTTGVGSTITSRIGMLIQPQTGGTNNYTASLGASSTAGLWLSYNTNSTTVGGGIAFGQSRDTNLYRSAADTLKTDDKLIAAAGLGVGNSAAAATPGTVVRKIEVFDASGASLGFIPVYDSIT